MRKFANIAIVVCALASIGFGVLFFSAVRAETGEATLESALEAIAEEERRGLPVVGTFDLTPWLRGEKRALLEPSALLPATFRWSQDEMRAFLNYSKTCTEDTNGKRPDSLQKAYQWHRFLCDQGTLPTTFFASPPYIHPLGSSYVFLAHHGSRPEFRDAEWLTKVLPFAHALELVDLRKQLDIALAAPWSYIADLSPTALRTLMLQGDWIIGGEYMFYRNLQSIGTGLVAEYHVYHRSEVESLARDHGYAQSPVANGLIWGIGMGASFFGFCGMVAVSGFRRWHEVRRDQRERMMIFQTLTHELRTPVTELSLLLEKMRGRFDHLEGGDQETLLRVFDANARLHRVVEGSTRYLRSADKALNLEVIANPSEICRDVSSEFEIDLVVIKEAPVQLDRFWFTLCLRNVIDNAMRHGSGTVRMQVDIKRDHLAVSVTDEGAGWQSPSPGGLGLGLKIVEHAMRGMDGRLLISRQPSKVTLLLRRVR